MTSKQRRAVSDCLLLLAMTMPLQVTLDKPSNLWDKAISVDSTKNDEISD